jgi:hypothetical protein
MPDEGYYPVWQLSYIKEDGAQRAIQNTIHEFIKK